MNFDYLRLNEQEIKFIKHEGKKHHKTNFHQIFAENYIKTGLNTKAIRRIFYNVNYDDFENNYIHMLRKKIESEEDKIIKKLIF